MKIKSPFTGNEYEIRPLNALEFLEFSEMQTTKDQLQFILTHGVEGVDLANIPAADGMYLQLEILKASGMTDKFLEYLEKAVPKSLRKKFGVTK